MTQSQKGKTYYAKINSFFLLAKEIIAVICNFVLPRAIISAFGSSYNGLVASITQFLNILSLLRLGIAGSMRFQMYKPLAENNNDELSCVVNTYQSYNKKTGIIALIYIAVLSVVYPLLFRGEFTFLNTFLLVVAAGSVAFSQHIFGIVSSNLLIANQRSYIVHILDGLTSILVTVVSVLLITFGFGLPVIKLITSVFYVVVPVLLFIIVKKKYKINKKIPTDKKKLSKKNDVMVHSISNIIHDNTDIWALTILSTKALISVYSVYSLVISGLRQVMAVFTGSLEAPFGDLYARKDITGIKKNFALYEFATFGLVSILFGTTFLLLLPFVKNYTRNITDTVYVLPLYAVFVVFSGISYCLRIPYQTVLQAGGFYKETRKFAVAEATLNLLITFSLVPFLGLIGAAIGTLVANGFRTLTYSWFLDKKVFKQSMFHFVKNVFWLLINISAIYCLGNRVVSLLAYIDFANWILCGFLVVGISFGVVFATSLLFFENQLFVLLKKFFTRRFNHSKISK